MEKSKKERLHMDSFMLCHRSLYQKDFRSKENIPDGGRRLSERLKSLQYWDFVQGWAIWLIGLLFVHFGAISRRELFSNSPVRYSDTWMTDK